MDREELFKRAMERRKKEKQEEEQRGKGGYNTSFEPIAYTALEKDQMSVVRILGVPMETREMFDNGQFSAKAVNLAMITGDNGKKFRCIFPDKAEQPSWIMWKILDLVLSSTWDRDANSRVFHNAGTQVFEMVYKNGVNKEAGNRYNFEKGWKPTQSVAMNVIDRDRMDWHKSEGKTLVLSKRVNSSTNKQGETTHFYDVGVPLMLYKMILDDIAETKGDYEKYDIGIVKLDHNPWYSVTFLPTADPDFLKKYGDLNLQYVNSPLTEEERMLKQWDLDKYFPVTTYTKIKNRLSAKIQMIDKHFGTNFLEELEELALKEKAERDESKAQSTDDNDEFDPDNVEAEIQEEKPKARPATRRSAKKEAEPFDVSSLDRNVYKGLDELSEEMLEMIIGVNSDGSLSYELPPNTQVYACGECQFESPENFTHCPKCGVMFD